jgi:hypothetical protein
VVRERKTPDPEVTLTAQARLTGPEFEADTLQGHQLIHSYTVREKKAAQWIRDISKHFTITLVNKHYET